MKFVLSVASVFLATTAVALAAGFHLEAGVSHAELNGGDYSLSNFTPNSEAANTLDPSYFAPVSSRGKSAAAPFVAVGYAFSDHFGLRLGYQHIGRTSATSVADVVIAGETDPGSVTTRYSDEVHIATMAPEFRWQVTPVVSLVLAPELNWVTSDAEVRITTNNPTINIVPHMSRTDRELTWGGSLGAEWSLAPHWKFLTRYNYVDLKPSWGRHGHLLSGGLQWRF